MKKLVSRFAFRLIVLPLLLSLIISLYIPSFSALASDIGNVWNLPRQYSGIQGQYNWYYFAHRQGAPMTDLVLLSYDNYVSPWGTRPFYCWNNDGSRYMEFVGRDPSDWRNIGPGGASGWLQPGEYGYNNFAIGWKAPQAGAIYISGIMTTAYPDATASGWSDDGVCFSIYKGSTRLAGPSLVFRGNSESNRVHSVTLKPSTTVGAGDMIYFYIDRKNWQDADGMYYSFSVSYDPGADLTAPVSSYSYATGTLSLSATDAGSGVARIEYRTYYPAWTEWTQYTGPIPVSNGQKLMFRALDNAGNIEPYQRLTIDAIAPITTAASSPPPNAAGWHKSDVTVTLSAVDNVGGSGVKEIHYIIDGGAETVVSDATTSFVLNLDGTHNAVYFAKDNFGNAEQPKTIVVRIDKTPPSITATRTPQPNAAGWNNTDVKVSFTATDAGSGVETCSAPVVLSAHGANQSVTGIATDRAGNTSSITVSGINIDKHAPTLAFAEPGPAPNDAGWNNTDVAIPFIVADDLSGVATTSFPSPLLLSTEGDNVSTAVTVTDVAGNSATFTSPSVKIDKTPPVITINTPIVQEYSTAGNISIDYVVEDTLSGVGGVIATLDGVPVSQGQTINLADKAGNHTFTVTCTDVAGNTATKSVSFSVTIAANIDINPDTLNPKSKGNPVTAYIELPEGYDVRQIDVSTVKLKVNGTKITAQAKPTAVGDYDGDGIADLMVKFDREVLIANLSGQSGDITLTISGSLTNGIEFTGTDTIRVLAK